MYAVEGTELIIDWLYSNEDSEVYEPKVLRKRPAWGRFATPDILARMSEPASKAIDGTSPNGPKWCVTNAETGYADDDITGRRSAAGAVNMPRPQARMC